MVGNENRTSISLSPAVFDNELGSILPTADQTLLLRACLCSGEPARRAWEAWLASKERGSSLEEETLAVRSLRLLLLEALRKNQIEAESGLTTLLRTATLKEELRYQIYRRICAEVLTAFAGRGIEVLILKGAALAETVYPAPTLRHCHDLDLLLRKDQRSLAGRLLEDMGFARFAAATDNHLRFDHPSGLPVELHCAPFRVPYYNGIDEGIRRRSQPVRIMDKPARIPSPSDSLLHACVHASYCSSRQSLRWVSDAWFVLDRHPSLDWNNLVQAAGQGRLALPLWLTLAYLAHELDARVPPGVLEGLRSAALNTDSLGRSLALLGARAETLQDLEKLDGVTAGLGGRWILLKEQVRRRLASEPSVQQTLARWQWFCRFAHRAVTPGARDRALVALPNSLLFVYYLLRPIRLLWENGLVGVVKDVGKIFDQARS